MLKLLWLQRKSDSVAVTELTAKIVTCCGSPFGKDERMMPSIAPEKLFSCRPSGKGPPARNLMGGVPWQEETETRRALPTVAGTCCTW